MRRIKLSAELTLTLYKVLEKGKGGRGYTTKELRQIDPVMRDIEDASNSDDPDKVSFNKDFIFGTDIKESEYSLAKQCIENSPGWMANRQGRMILELQDIWDEIPIESDSSKEGKGDK